MFRITFLFFLLYFTSLASFAAESICTKLAGQAENLGISYYPAVEAKIISRGKISFYNSPNAKCKMQGVYAVKGDYLTVYKSYRGWVNVMYVGKDGTDFIGWLPEANVKIMGQYGRTP